MTVRPSSMASRMCCWKTPRCTSFRPSSDKWGAVSGSCSVPCWCMLLLLWFVGFNTCGEKSRLTRPMATCTKRNMVAWVHRKLPRSSPASTCQAMKTHSGTSCCTWLQTTTTAMPGCLSGTHFSANMHARKLLVLLLHCYKSLPRAQNKGARWRQCLWHLCTARC
jgi:hypothetical protein